MEKESIPGADQRNNLNEGGNAARNRRTLQTTENQFVGNWSKSNEPETIEIVLTKSKTQLMFYLFVQGWKIDRARKFQRS